MTNKLAIIPAKERPTTTDPDEAGTTWVVESRDGVRLATIYRNADGGHGADMSSALSVGACLIVGAGLPRLPLTRTNDASDDPLTWDEVAAEVQATLELDGWAVAMIQAPRLDDR